MEVVRFWLNNWTCGETYPNEEPFIYWFKDDPDIKLADADWVKENKLCIKIGSVDLSIVFDITAPKEWVDKNCPCIYKYPKYFATPVQPEDPESGKPDYRFSEYYLDHFGYEFLEYLEENIGITYVDEDDNVIEVEE